MKQILAGGLSAALLVSAGALPAAARDACALDTGKPCIDLMYVTRNILYARVRTGAAWDFLRVGWQRRGNGGDQRELRGPEYTGAIVTLPIVSNVHAGAAYQVGVQGCTRASGAERCSVWAESTFNVPAMPQRIDPG